MKFYLAARFERREELKKYVRDLENAGHTNASSWIFTETQSEDLKNPGEFYPEYRRCAERDLEDIEKSDMLIFFCEDLESCWPRGGRHVELGYALGKNKTIFLIGYYENIFHTLAALMSFPTWEGFLEYVNQN